MACQDFPRPEAPAFAVGGFLDAIPQNIVMKQNFVPARKLARKLLKKSLLFGEITLGATPIQPRTGWRVVLFP